MKFKYILTVIGVFFLASAYPQTTGKIEAVDLGLPSGTLWANMNIGATKPEETGSYFAWGEVNSKTKTSWGITRECYSKDNYLGYQAGWDEKDEDGFIVKKHPEIYPEYGTDIKNTEYDAAHVILGIDWCLPSLKDFQELKDNCHWESTSKNGEWGFKISSLVNDNWIFIPGAGCCTESGIGLPGRCYYWTSTLDTRSENFDRAYAMVSGFNGDYFPLIDCEYRYLGLSIRPVKSGKNQSPSRCTTPTITFDNNRIEFKSETPNAVFHSTIKCNDVRSYTSSAIDLSSSFTVSVYAVADGYERSETITKNIEVGKVVEVEKIVEIETPIYIYDDSHLDIKLTTGESIRLTIVNGEICIENAPIGASVYVYSVAGELIEMNKVKEQKHIIKQLRNKTYIVKIEENILKIKI